MLDAIRQMGTRYYNSLPSSRQILYSMGTGAALSFAATALLCRKPGGLIDLNPVFTAAAVAATASLVHALATPLFQDVFGDARYSTLELAKMMIVNVTTSALMHAISSGGSTKFFLFMACSANFCASLLGAKINDENPVYFYVNI
jgi:hypothetical protein